DGLDIREHPLAVEKKIGFLPETPPLYVEMTVREYLNFIYDLKKCNLNRKAHIQEVCSVVKIEDTMDRMIKNLSKGYRQRVGIAGAIIGNPEVIIFDEPTNGLDPKQIIDIRNLIRELGKERTIILSTHILSEVKAVCDRIIIINEGKIVADELTENIEGALRGNRRLTIRIEGPSASVHTALKKIPGVIYAEISLEHEDGSATFIVESKNEIDVRKPIFYMLAQHSWPILSLEFTGANLEDIFISVVDETEETTVKKA
ncbi:MAG: ATP-binding cassette domain-containing protein, partial [Clostridia bacterium]|nr:ATP-binding cassette domain-containing protein [Clostridia bacterium]